MPRNGGIDASILSLKITDRIDDAGNPISCLSIRHPKTHAQYSPLQGFVVTAEAFPPPPDFTVQPVRVPDSKPPFTMASLTSREAWVMPALAARAYTVPFIEKTRSISRTNANTLTNNLSDRVLLSPLCTRDDS
jgi:hypothetical protein